MKTNWLTKNFAELIANLLDGFSGFISNTIINIFDKDIEIMTSKEVSAAVLLTTAIATVLVIILSFKTIFTTYVTETDGDPDSDSLQIYVRIAMSLALIQSNTFIFNTLLTLSKKFTTDLVGKVQAREFFGSLSSSLTLMATPTTNLAAVIVTIVLINVIFLVAFAIKAGIRAGELILFKITFPIFACDKIGNNQERFNAFITSYMITFFGYAIQLFCVRLALNRSIAAFTEGVTGTFQNYLAAFVLYYLALKAPKWLEKFSYSSGIGQMAAGGARSIGYMIPSLLKKGV